MYMIVNLDLKYGEYEVFFENFPKLQKLMEAAPNAPRLLAGFIATFGLMFRVTHIWETASADGFIGAVDYAMRDSSFPGILNRLKEACIQEVLMFAEQTPYSPGLIGR